VSRDVDVGKLRKWIGKATTAAEPPPNVTDVAKQSAADDIVQLNLKIPASLKRRLKHLAARDDVSLTTLLARMVAEYEKAHGPLPPIER
jgi:hypothetical protein